MTKEGLFSEPPLDPSLQEAMIKHGKILEELKKLGISELIEETAGSKIPPLIVEEENGEVRAVTLSEYSGVIHKGPFSQEWRLGTIPQKLNDGTYADIVRISGQRAHDFTQSEPHLQKADVSSVSIEWNPDRVLKISGATEVYNGVLGTSIDNDILQGIGIAIEQAFNEPKQESSLLLASLA